MHYEEDSFCYATRVFIVYNIDTCSGNVDGNSRYECWKFYGVGSI